MKPTIECPVCEHSFPLTLEPGQQQLTCPVCSKTFDVAAANIASPSGVRPATSPLLPEPTAEQTNANLGEAPTTTKTVEQTGLTTSELKPVVLPRRKTGWRFILFTLTLFLLIAGLGATVFIKLQDEFSSIETRTPVLGQPVPDTIETEESETEPTTDLDEHANSVGRPNPEPQIAEPNVLPEPKRSVFTRKDLRRCRNTILPQLVSLTVVDDLGQHVANGLIVDSRGWVLTSFNAVVNAAEITVASASSGGAGDKKERLTDLVRSVIAIDRDQKLALLEINRRFVISLAEPNLAAPTDARIVPGQSLLICRSPTRKNPHAIVETKIVSRPKHSALNFDARSRYSRIDPGTVPEYWLEHSNGMYAEPGSPMVDENMQVAAIHVFNIDLKGYALPVRYWRKILPADTPSPQPLSSLAAGTPKHVIEPNQPGRNDSVRLNRLAELCTKFDWLPESDSEYDTLVEFAKTLNSVNEKLGEEPDAIKFAKLTKQIHGYRADFTRPREESNLEIQERVATLNQLSEKRLKRSGQTVIVVGETHFVSMLEISSVVLSLPGIDQRVAIPVDPKQPPLKPKHNWLVFARTGVGKSEQLFSDGESAIQLEAIAEPWPLPESAESE